MARPTMYSSSDDTGLLRVLRLLQAHDSEYLSGQDLADVLRMSRVAVWKHVKRLGELGYAIESGPKSGYRLAAGTELPLPWEVVSGLGTKLVGKKAYYVGEASSTQDVAARLAADPENDGAIVIAGRQTAGRGRSGKPWASPPGGIWLSVIFRPRFDVQAATLFPLAASLALSRAIKHTSGARHELRWPNDITIRGKKAAGILVDATLESGRIGVMLLGVGINFDVDAKSLEAQLGGAPGFYGAASLRAHGKKARPVELVRRFLAELEDVYMDLEAGRADGITSGWTARSSTIGKKVRAETSGGTVEGRAVRIDADGALVVCGASGEARIVAGDVAYRNS